MAKKRYNIGLLVAGLTDNYSNRVAMGAMAAAKELDANLIVFPGKNVDIQHINALYETEYEFQYNVLFDLAAQAKLDYLIVVAGAILFAHSRDYHKEFLAGFGDTPVLCVASEVEGFDYLQHDNRSGVTTAVNYLASHGRKHIGMIAGELHNHEFEQRYQAYRQALADNGLEFKESYMTPCSLTVPAVKEANWILDANPELDAIVCGNDVIAMDTCEVLKTKNIRIGIDVAVVGFDDLPMAVKLDPPLASVKANAVELGHRAVEKVVNRLNGVSDDSRYLEAQFVPRRSCFTYADDSNVPEKVFFGDYSEMLGHIHSFFTERRINAAVDGSSYDRIIELVQHLYANYVQQHVDEKTVKKTIRLLDHTRPLIQDSEVNRIFHGIYIWFIRNCPVDNIPYVQMLHQYFRADRNTETVRSLSRKFENRTHYDNRFIRDALMFSGSLNDSYARILKRLDTIGAASSFLYTFERPIVHHYDEPFPTDLKWNFQSYTYGPEAFSLPRDAQKITTPEVFDNPYLWQGGQHIFIATVLFSAETLYGISLLEPKSEDFFEELELITYQLSSAVRTLDILKNQELLVDELHATNLALDRMSKIDELTGIYNRKGFFPAAEKMVSDPKYQGKSFIICYADMDDLKPVNDTYGHGEGDFAIQIVAQCLAHALGEGAVIGRMGGDEFAAIIPASAEISIETLTQRKERFIREFNESKVKPYPFSMSMGVVEHVCDSSFDLNKALDEADDLLYIEKRKKKGKAKKQS